MAFTQADLDNFREKALTVGTPTFIGKAEKIDFNKIGETAIPLKVTAPVRLVGLMVKNIVGNPAQFEANIYSAPNGGGVLMWNMIQRNMNFSGKPETSFYQNVDGQFAATKTAYVRVTHDNMFGPIKADLYLFGIYSPV